MTLGVRDMLVHGTLLLLLSALLVAFVNYARGRGLSRWPVITGLILFSLGFGALLAAGRVDGFVIPRLAARFAAAFAPSQDAAMNVLTACSVSVDVMTAFGVVAMAIAIAAWSLDLARDPGALAPA